MSDGYAGDITPREAWQRLAHDPKAVLVDVRTAPEWNYVGVPDLAGLDRPLLRIEWQSFPDGTLNPRFAEQVAAAGVAPGQPVLLLCRSGARSRSAAKLLTGLGWQECYNISDGFEGPQDPSRHRGAVAGWKHDGLPWVQG